MDQDYLYDNLQNPHPQRRKAMLEKYPEIKKYYKSYPLTFILALIFVASQIALAAFFHDKAWYWMVLGAYVFGAILNHNLFIVVHEATHNMIFRTTVANKWASLIACLPQVFPSAIAFRKFHLLHHSHQGEMDFDADLANEKEANWVGTSSFRKAFWLFGFLLVEGVVRTSRFRHIKWLDKWVILNLALQIVFGALVVYFLNFQALLYLTLSTVFSIGLHPLGARWIQEHYVFKENQETYSYYGPVNRFSMNIGYHNEHHDFSNVPWVHLPKIKKLAPEFYDNLMFHPSYSKIYH